MPPVAVTLADIAVVVAEPVAVATVAKAPPLSEPSITKLVSSVELSSQFSVTAEPATDAV